MSPSPPAGVFIAGTDTSVGKTTVAVGLARLLRRWGRRPIPYKPVETGCAPEPLDATRLWRAADRPVPLADVCPYALAMPAAPAAAAEAVGLSLSVGDLAARALELSARGDGLIVEGAGGLLAPYAPGETNADLASKLGLPVVLVARTGLGTINHTALTIAELARRRLEVVGLVLVRTRSEAEPHETSNSRWIEATCGVAPLGTIPWLTETGLASDDDLADAVAHVFPESMIRRLFGDVSGPGPGSGR